MMMRMEMKMTMIMIDDVRCMLMTRAQATLVGSTKIITKKENNAQLHNRMLASFPASPGGPSSMVDIKSNANARRTEKTKCQSQIIDGGEWGRTAGGFDDGLCWCCMK